MSIRLRLALWYGALFTCILLPVSILTYGLHARGHYEDVDRLLINSAAQVAGLSIPSTGDELSVVLRLYDSNGRQHEQSTSIAAPALDPRSVLANPAGPPYDALVALAPPLTTPMNPLDGSFGILDDGMQRWRVFVLPLQSKSAPAGFVAALAPLGELDESIRLFRISMAIMGVLGIGVAVGGGWAIAGHALRPVDTMIQTAREIERIHDVSRRISIPFDQDELGRLAQTFNQMLASLEDSHRAQQRFVADASHELRAPLTAIQGNLQLLRRQQQMPAEERAEVLQEVEREATRLARMVADLLALARADAGIPIRRQRVDVDAVILHALQGAQPLTRGHTFEIEPFEPLQIIGDEDRLEQLVLILVDNALKYSPPGSRVTLGLEALENQARLTVADSGVGIAAEDLAHVFDRFYRADPARSRDPGGTGLGLPIARWIVDQHGGTIDIASTPGVGTTVSVMLPLPKSP